MGDDDLGAKTRDMAYTAVGFGVLAVQRLQVARRDLMRDLNRNVGPVVRQVQLVMDPVLDALEHRLPFPGRIVFRQARTGARRFQESLFADR